MLGGLKNKISRHLENRKQSNEIKAGEKKASETNSTKFIGTLLKNRIEMAKSVKINVNFLGSGHPASKHPGSGKQYGAYKHVYINYTVAGNVCNIDLTFSGPTKLDIKKPNIKSITKEAKEILGGMVPDIRALERNIKISIFGHSRGGIVADKIHNWISNNHFGEGVILENLSIADPYAGPVNRRIHKKFNNFDISDSKESNDKNQISVSKNIPANKVVVYTVAEKRFRTPSKSLQSNVIVFSDVSHDKTKYISQYIVDNSMLYPKGIYICADAEDKFKDVVHNNPEDIDLWMFNHIDIIDKNNINKILEGGNGGQNKNYKNFAYKKISSDGRRELFYKGLAIVDQGEVEKFLEKNKHTNMLKKIKSK